VAIHYKRFPEAPKGQRAVAILTGGDSPEGPVSAFDAFSGLVRCCPSMVDDLPPASPRQRQKLRSALRGAGYRV